MTHEGELVRVRDLTLDLGHGDARVPPAVRIFIGPTGPRMMELSGEVADGVLINGILSPAYTARSQERVAAGAARAGRTLADVEKLQLVNISMDADRGKALYDAKRLVTQYLGQQPHFAKAWEFPEDRLAEIKQVMGGWPPKPGGIEEAMALGDDALVDELIRPRHARRVPRASATLARYRPRWAHPDPAQPQLRRDPGGLRAVSAQALRAAVEARLLLADSLFDEIRAASAADVGVTPPRLERTGPVRRHAHRRRRRRAWARDRLRPRGQPLLHAARP